MAFAGWREHWSGLTNTSSARELLYGDLRYLEIDLFFPLCRHGIRNPGKRDILSHPDVLQAPPPCFLPETD